MIAQMLGPRAGSLSDLEVRSALIVFAVVVALVLLGNLLLYFSGKGRK